MEICKKKNKTKRIGAKAIVNLFPDVFFFFFNNHCILGHPEEVMIIVRLLIDSFKKIIYLCLFILDASDFRTGHGTMEMNIPGLNRTDIFHFKKTPDLFFKANLGLKKAQINKQILELKF